MKGRDVMDQQYDIVLQDRVVLSAGRRLGTVQRLRGVDFRCSLSDMVILSHDFRMSSRAPEGIITTNRRVRNTDRLAARAKRKPTLEGVFGGAAGYRCISHCRDPLINLFGLERQLGSEGGQKDVA